MKAVLSNESGGPESLVVEDIDAPVPGPGEVLIDVAACAINYPDTLIIKDMYQFKPPRPFSPGGEISGTIAALGEGVTGWQIGDRVIAGTGSGGLREQVTLQAARLFRVPDGIDLVQASALLMTYGTTIHGLKDRGDIAEAQTVLVLGAPRFMADGIAALRKAGVSQSIFVLSYVPPGLIVKLVGVKGARGVGIAQTFPNPNGKTLPLHREFHAAMKEAFPQVTEYTPFQLEGYLSARTVGEALKRSKELTAASLQSTLSTMGMVDFGGFRVDFSKGNVGSRFVDIGVIGADGRLRY